MVEQSIEKGSLMTSLFFYLIILCKYYWKCKINSQSFYDIAFHNFKHYNANELILVGMNHPIV